MVWSRRRDDPNNRGTVSRLMMTRSDALTLSAAATVTFLLIVTPLSNAVDSTTAGSHGDGGHGPHGAGGHSPQGAGSHGMVGHLVNSSLYVEHMPGSGLPLILSAPHGGRLSPPEILERNVGCLNDSKCIWRHQCGVKNATKCRATTVSDSYTIDLTRELRSKLCQLFNGTCPAAILNLLIRSKFDANRDSDEATFGVPEVVKAFNAFHGCIELEKRAIKRGLFLDIHGQSHAIERAELGYLVKGNDLDKPDPIDARNTSVRSLASRHASHEFDELLRGAKSLGAFLEEQGFRAVPSPKDRGPAGNVYFDGGYNTIRHGSKDGGEIDAIQIESARSPRDPDHRPRYTTALACAIKKFVCTHYVSSGDVINANVVAACSSPSLGNEHVICNGATRLSEVSGVLAAAALLLFLIYFRTGKQI